MKSMTFLAIMLLMLIPFSESFGKDCCSESFNESLFKGKGYIPSGGFIPNKETAIKMAEAILTPIYGKETILSEKPFRAILNNGVWQVKGTLKKGKLGGVAYIYFSKNTAHVLKVIHTQ